jgi:hypothetical protein
VDCCSPSCAKWEDDIRIDAATLGDPDLKLDGVWVWFGDLKKSLSPLKLKIKDCREPGIRYVDCKEAQWGSAGIVRARFLMSKRSDHSEIGDLNNQLHELRINDNFKGTLCGERIDQVKASKVACGHPITVVNYGTGRNDILMAHRNRINTIRRRAQRG